MSFRGCTWCRHRPRDAPQPGNIATRKVAAVSRGHCGEGTGRLELIAGAVHLAESIPLLRIEARRLSLADTGHISSHTYAQVGQTFISLKLLDRVTLRYTHRKINVQLWREKRQDHGKPLPPRVNSITCCNHRPHLLDYFAHHSFVSSYSKPSCHSQAWKTGNGRSISPEWLAVSCPSLPADSESRVSTHQGSPQSLL